MRILNLFADADGESHFREINIDCTNETPWGLKISKRLPATAILFVEGTGTDADVLLQSPHCRRKIEMAPGAQSRNDTPGPRSRSHRHCLDVGSCPMRPRAGLRRCREIEQRI